MLPITATPSVAPKSRVASLTADPTPAFSLGTTPMIASVAGAEIRPRPPPPMSICPTRTAYGVDWDTVATQNRNAPVRSRPLATTALFPILTASFVPSTEATASDVATGKIRTPVPRGV